MKKLKHLKCLSILVCYMIGWDHEIDEVVEEGEQCHCCGDLNVLGKERCKEAPDCNGNEQLNEWECVCEKNNSINNNIKYNSTSNHINY